MMYEKDCSFICFISNSWCKYLLGLYWIQQETCQNFN